MMVSRLPLAMTFGKTRIEPARFVDTSAPATPLIPSSATLTVKTPHRVSMRMTLLLLATSQTFPLSPNSERGLSSLYLAKVPGQRAETRTEG